MGPKEFGWNCGNESDEWIAAEFAQPTIDDPIDDTQVDAYCWWVRNEVLPVWPRLPHVIVAHSDLQQGIAQGKSDPYRRGSPELEAFKGRVRQRLGW
jgi:hypothetical protein